MCWSPTWWCATARRRRAGSSIAEGQRYDVSAPATLLATGGAGQVFRETTNPGVATGDGVALAYHAGARVIDLEFVQFHPTALNKAGAPRFLISEALRGEGARLVNASGEAFMTRYHPDGDLAPRDVVARGIVREAERTRGPVFLTLAHLDAAHVRERFPTITETCRQVGLDIATRSDSGRAGRALPDGRHRDRRVGTDLARRPVRRRRGGLHRRPRREPARQQLAARRTGVRRPRRDRHARAPRAAATQARSSGAGRASSLRACDRPAGAADLQPRRVRSSWPTVRDLMWRLGGTVPHRDGSAGRGRRASTRPTPIDRRAGGSAWSFDARDWRRINLLAVARLIARAALRRHESRGGHFRDGFPRARRSTLEGPSSSDDIASATHQSRPEMTDRSRPTG